MKKLTLALIGSLLLAAPLSAATYYWTPSSTATGQWANGAGTAKWSLTSGDLAPNVVWPNATSNAATLQRNVAMQIGTGTASETVTVTDLTVESGSLLTLNSPTVLATSATRNLLLTGSSSGNVLVGATAAAFVNVGTYNQLNLQGTFNGEIEATLSGRNRIQLMVAGAGGANTKINLTGGELVLTAGISGSTVTIGELKGTSGTVSPNSGSGGIRTLEVNQSTTTTFAGTLLADSGVSGRMLALKKSGIGTLTLSNAANSYGGATTLTGGTLSVSTLANGGSASGIGQSSNAAANLVFDGGTLQYTGANVTSDRAFTINAGKTAIIETTNNLSFAGATGAATNGALTKTGVGMLTLTGVNTYTGTTLVSEGTLVLSGGGSIAGSTVVDVQSGATLSTSGITFGTGQTVRGNGTIIGDTILQGTLAAGNSPGILSFDDDLTLTSSANSIFEIQNTGMVRGTDYDGVNVVSSLTYDGTLTLDMTTLVNDGAYNLFDFGSIAGNFDTVVFTGGIYTGTFSYSAGFWTATDLGGSGQIFSFELASGNLTVVPEPSTTLLLAGALTALVVFRRRRP